MCAPMSLWYYALVVKDDIGVSFPFLTAVLAERPSHCHKLPVFSPPEEASQKLAKKEKQLDCWGEIACVLGLAGPVIHSNTLARRFLTGLAVAPRGVRGGSSGW